MTPVRKRVCLAKYLYEIYFSSISQNLMIGIIIVQTEIFKQVVRISRTNRINNLFKEIVIIMANMAINSLNVGINLNNLMVIVNTVTYMVTRKVNIEENRTGI